MSKKFISRMSLKALIIHVVLIIALGQLLSLYTSNFMILSFMIYSVLTILLKKFVPVNLRKGMELVKAGKHLEAVTEFRLSYDFFTKYAWLDKYRAIFMLSVMPMSYREMSLINIGYCYSQIEEVIKARVIYEKIIQQYPKNQVAIYALALLNKDIPQQ